MILSKHTTSIILKLFLLLAVSVTLVSCDLSGSTSGNGSKKVGITLKTTTPMHTFSIHGKVAPPNPLSHPDPDALNPTTPLASGPYRAPSNKDAPLNLPGFSTSAGGQTSLRSSKSTSVTAAAQQSDLLKWTSADLKPRTVNVGVYRDTDLTATTNGWETSEADAGDVIFYTGNYFAAYSSDRGRSFTALDVGSIVPQATTNWCCDQRVVYVPQIDRFVWIVQYSPSPQTNENQYTLLWASPAQVVANQGTVWNASVMTSQDFGLSHVWMDYPDLTYGSQALYFSFNAIGSGGAVLARIQLSLLANNQNLVGHYTFSSIPGIAIAQGCQTRVYFAAEINDSQLRVWYLDEGSATAYGNDINIATIPTQNWTSVVPNSNGVDWLGSNTKIASAIHGATLAGSQLWLAWSAAQNDTQGHHLFPQSHIELAVVDVNTFHLVAEHYLANANYAAAWPDLATNSLGDIGITFAAGGGNNYVAAFVGLIAPDSNYDVGFQMVTPQSSDQSLGGGGHFMNIRTSFPETRLFSAAVYDAPTDPANQPYGYHTSPHWILFGPPVLSTGEPIVHIEAPGNGTHVNSGLPFLLVAKATTAAGQPLPASAVVWTANGRELGTGSTLTTSLTASGVYTVQVTGTEIVPNSTVTLSASDRITLHVDGAGPPPPQSPTVQILAPTAGTTFYFPQNTGFTLVLSSQASAGVITYNWSDTLGLVSDAKANDTLMLIPTAEVLGCNTPISDTISVQVTDSQGQTAQASVGITLVRECNN